MLNILIVICIVIAGIGWFLHRSDPQKSPFFIAIPAAGVILIIIFQIIFGTGNQRESQKVESYRQTLKTFQFDYAAGARLAQEAARANPNTEGIILVPEGAPKRLESEVGQWLLGVQDTGKKSGLKLTIVPLPYTDFIPGANRVVGSMEIKTEAIDRIHQTNPNVKVWLSYYLPQPAVISESSFLGTDGVRLYCFAQFIAGHNSNASWWTNQLKAGRMQAVVLERYGYGLDQNKRGMPVDDPDANFKASYFLLTPETLQLPPELAAQLPDNLRN